MALKTTTHKIRCAASDAGFPKEFLSEQLYFENYFHYFKVKNCVSAASN